jgi:hypothetical protein
MCDWLGSRDGEEHSGMMTLVGTMMTADGLRLTACGNQMKSVTI